MKVCATGVESFRDVYGNIRSFTKTNIRGLICVSQEGNKITRSFVEFILVITDKIGRGWMYKNFLFVNFFKSFKKTRK